jgi:hypothetical protein
MSTPTAAAVFLFTTSSMTEGRSIGSSPGLAPFLVMAKQYDRLADQIAALLAEKPPVSKPDKDRER